jgi:hypothetical protein
MDNVGNGDEDYCFKCESSKIVWKFGMPLTGVRVLRTISIHMRVLQVDRAKSGLTPVELAPIDESHNFSAVTLRSPVGYCELSPETSQPLFHTNTSAERK